MKKFRNLALIVALCLALMPFAAVQAEAGVPTVTVVDAEDNALTSDSVIEFNKEYTATVTGEILSAAWNICIEGTDIISDVLDPETDNDNVFSVTLSEDAYVAFLAEKAEFIDSDSVIALRFVAYYGNGGTSPASIKKEYTIGPRSTYQVTFTNTGNVTGAMLVKDFNDSAAQPAETASVVKGTVMVLSLPSGNQGVLESVSVVDEDGNTPTWVKIVVS